MAVLTDSVMAAAVAQRVLSFLLHRVRQQPLYVPASQDISLGASCVGHGRCRRVFGNSTS